MFSVIVTLFNKEKYACRAIDSVLAQSCQDFELNVVNDGSTDKTASLLDSYTDTRIKIFHTINQGAGNARNYGVKKSTREWIAFLDGDDYWSIDHLDELKKIINEHEDIGIVSTTSIEVNSTEIADKDVVGRQGNIGEIDYFLLASKTNGVIHSSSVAINKKVFEEIGYFTNSKTGEDMEFWARVCLHYKCASSNRATSYYCRGTGGIMDSLWHSSPQFPVIKSIDDIGLDVALVNKFIRQSQFNFINRNSLVKYVNSRINRAIKQRLYGGQIYYIRNFNSLYLYPLSLTDRFYKVLALLPVKLLNAFHMFRQFIKQSYHFFRPV